MSFSRLDSFLKNNISLFLKDSSFFSQEEKEALFSLSRSFWQKQIERKRLDYQGKKIKSSTKISFQDFSKIYMDWKKIKRDFYFTRNANKLSYPAPLQILKNKKNFFIINKPAGLSVHQPDKTNLTKERPLTLVEIINSKRLIDKNFNDPRSGIVHRLDKRTSGVLVVAKNNLFQKEIKKGFKNREIKKRYLALVSGKFPYQSFYIHGMMGKKRDNPRLQGVENLIFKEGQIKNISSFWNKYCISTKNIITPNKSGLISPKPSFSAGKVIFFGEIDAISAYLNKNDKLILNVYERWKNILSILGNSKKNNKQVSLLEIFPFSGRTHQIRVHLAETGFPIIGDDTYGGPFGKELPCHFLHAFNIFWRDGENIVGTTANEVLLF